MKRTGSDGFKPIAILFNNMEIKRISVEELGLVVPVFDLYRQFYLQEPNVELAEKFIRERLSHNGSVIFVALEKGDTIGFTQLYPIYSSVRATKNWILNDLYVVNEHRKTGVGQALIAEAMKFAGNDGATFVQLETAADNRTAQRLYEAIGFKKQEPETFFL